VNLKKVESLIYSQKKTLLIGVISFAFLPKKKFDRGKIVWEKLMKNRYLSENAADLQTLIAALTKGE
jgi:hypothetical protein